MGVIAGLPHTMERLLSQQSLDLVLHLGCIFVTGLSKVPQIITLHRSDEIGGFSVSSLHLQLFSNSLQTGFYINESYPVIIYLEYPLLILQELLLLYIVGRLSSSILSSLQYITGYITLIALVGGGLFSKAIILFILSFNIPLGLSSKVVQVNDIRKEGSSDSVSSVPFLINILTRLARLYTTFTSTITPEPLLVINSIIQISANTVVLAVIQMFASRKKYV